MNNSTGEHLNVTSPSTLCSVAINTPAASIIKSAIYSVIALASLLGNSLLILIFVRTKTMKKATNVFIISMAASDLFFPVFLIRRLIVSEITGSQVFLITGALGSFLCKISNFLSDVSVSVSTHSLIMITIERFVAIVFPFRIRQLSSKLRFYAILMVWIIALGIHSPYFYTFRLTESGYCETNWEPAFNHELTHSRYYTALFVVVVILPFTLVTILYGAIVWVLIFKKDKLLVHRSEASKKKNKSRELRILKMAATIVITFALCWAPFNVLQFLHLFAPEKLPVCSLLYSVSSQASLVLAVAYCTVNPIICFIYTRNYHLRESLATLRSQLSSSFPGTQRETEL